MAAAHRLHQLDPAAHICLLESSDRLGGVIRTEQIDGYLVERSADSFITNPATALDLCRQVGLADELIGTDRRYRTAYVVHRGRLVKLPEGFALMTAARAWPVVTTRLLSWPGKARLALEPLIAARRAVGDESFASFAQRRLGREAYERIVQPLVSGIYTADPERLSMQAALPRFVEMEQRHGSLLRAARREARQQSTGTGARYHLFMTPRRGLSSLIDAIAAQLSDGSLCLRHRVTQLSPRAEGGWQVSLAGPTGAQQQTFDAVVLATATTHAAELIDEFDGALAQELRGIEYAGCSIALVGVRREQIAHPLDAFGFVVPEIERRKILSASFSSIKFPGRAPEGRVLVRVFVGGACHPQLQALDDRELRRLVLEELGQLIGLSGEPELFQVARWDRKMPQYHLGHCQRVERIEQLVAQQAGLALAGNGYRGVGIPLCIADGQRAAERIAAQSGITTPRG